MSKQTIDISVKGLFLEATIDEEKLKSLISDKKNKNYNSKIIEELLAMVPSQNPLYVTLSTILPVSVNIKDVELILNLRLNNEAFCLVVYIENISLSSTSCLDITSNIKLTGTSLHFTAFENNETLAPFETNTNLINNLDLNLVVSARETLLKQDLAFATEDSESQNNIQLKVSNLKVEVDQLTIAGIIKLKYSFDKLYDMINKLKYLLCLSEKKKKNKQKHSSGLNVEQDKMSLITITTFTYFQLLKQKLIESEISDLEVDFYVFVLRVKLKEIFKFPYISAPEIIEYLIEKNKNTFINSITSIDLVGWVQIDEAEKFQGLAANNRVRNFCFLILDKFIESDLLTSSQEN